MSKLNVLYIVHDSTIAGTSLSTLNLIQSVKDYVTPIVLLHDKGQGGKTKSVYDLYREAGLEVIAYPFPINWDYRKCGRNVLRYEYYHLLEMKAFYLQESKSVEELTNILKDRNINVIHSASCVVSVGYRLSRALHAKLVWHVREFMDLDFNIKPMLGFWLTGLMIRHSDYAIAITKAVYQHWHLNWMKDRSRYLWDAVRSLSEISYDANKESFFLFCAGNLTHEKGADAAVEAFGESGLAKYGFKLKMIGNYSAQTKENLMDVAMKYHCTDAVELLGFISDIKPYMLKAKAFLMTSLNEGLGRTTVEAMFYGCPVIARHSGGTVDFMTNGKTGYFFYTVNECAQLMVKLSVETPKDIIDNAHALVRDHFSEESYGKAIISIYDKLMDKNE